MKPDKSYSIPLSSELPQRLTVLKALFYACATAFGWKIGSQLADIAVLTVSGIRFIPTN